MRIPLYLLMLIVSFHVNAQLYVVVGNDSPISDMTVEDIDDIADLYLGRKKLLGTTYINQVLDRTGDSRRRFFQRVTNMRESQINAYWAKLKFSGSMRAPEQVAAEQLLIDKLLSNPQAVGYTEVLPAQESGVKVILAIDE
ncbi:hypothetical protein L1D54_09030 [Vibrio brasiliensis]|uniref:hypothetical protein n=1 Tax=Vibrio brasiliensis TaxID=170652 RepID=UPI001EFD281E|nr:hypothetical protein [Vibrio brasiliensis]MCG9750620.1 hypothetical protein [Vibrio brasiliensis]MCG9780787.1 hypothetical protein [Vibrio brasiliensis]